MSPHPQAALGGGREIQVARTAGPCFGVRRALELVEALAGRPRSGRLVSLGPLCHNRREVERLRGLGLLPVGEAELCPDDEVVVRTHGLPPSALRALRGRVSAVHDATCPYVRSLQNLARRFSAAGYAIVVVGDRGHPEVQGALACGVESASTADGAAAISVSSAEELASRPQLARARKVALLAQTTQSPERLREVAAHCAGWMADGGRRLVELRVVDTICSATRERQREARELAGAVDLALVVGDRESANTRRLLEACVAVQSRTRLVESAEEIRPDWLDGVVRVAVTAGASTPDSAIREVVDRLADLDRE